MCSYVSNLKFIFPSKSILILLCLLFCYVSSHATLADQLYLDLHSNHSNPQIFHQHDSLMQLVGLSYVVNEYSFEEYIQAFKKLEAYAEAIQYKNNQIACKLMIAQILMEDLSLYVEASKIFIKCKDLTEEMGYYEGLGFSCSNLGVIYRKFGNFNIAEDYFRCAVDAYEQIPNISEDSVIYFSYLDALSHAAISFYFKDQNHIDSALNLHKNVIKKYENSLSFQVVQNALYTRLAALYNFNNNFKEAISSAQNDIINPKNKFTPSLLIDTHLEIAKGFMGLKNLDSAYAHLNKALNYYESTPKKNLVKLSKILLLKSEILNSQENYKEAFQLIEQSFETQKKFYDESESEVLLNTLKYYELSEKNKEILALEDLITTEKRTSRLKTIIILLSICIILFIGIIFNWYIKRRKTEKELLKNKLTIQKLELDRKNREISTQQLISIEKNNLLNQIKEKIDHSHNQGAKLSTQELDKLVKGFHSSEKDWQTFKHHFEEVHPSFFKSLATKSEEALSANEQKMCAYIKMNIGTKEIAQILNINPTSVQKSRYRIKKKMGLRKEEDLIQFIQSLS